MPSNDPPHKTTTLLRGLLKRLRGAGRADVSILPLDFDASAYLDLNPDVAEIGANPYQHYITKGHRDQRPYKRERSPAEGASSQHLPEDFDAETYLRLNPDLADYEGSLQDHFLRYGVQEFRSYREALPSVLHKDIPGDFDPDIYLLLNPDIAVLPLNPYAHYVNHGRSDSRLYKFPRLMASYGREAAPRKPTVLLVTHEASRTGAPVLTWNICQQLSATHNVVVLLLGDGTLRANFQLDAHATYLFPEALDNPAIAQHAAEELLQRHAFDYAILNSIETEAICEPLTLAGVPNLLLIREFAACILPQERLRHARTWASMAVFSTELTKSDAMACFPGLFERAMVMPHGRCLVPPAIFPPAFAIEPGARSALEIANTDRKLVIGLGTVNRRKGVDLFIEVATRMEALTGQQAFEFLWVGDGFLPALDPEYTAFLKDQISRAGLQDRMHIVAETDDLNTLYQKASLLVLSSRLDPLPNVAIDAICLGLPLVCFDKASGIADMLKAHGLQQPCVADYIDAADMARKAVRLLDNDIEPEVRATLRNIGANAFSMSRYCSDLIGLQEAATKHWNAASATVDAVLKSRYFDAPYYAGPAPYRQQAGERALCWEYVLSTALNATTRKPMPGFNPLAYRDRLSLPATQEPLLHLAQSSSEAMALITPDSCEPLNTAPAPGLRVALHVHAYYPELLPDILLRLQANQSPIDLFITVNSDAKSDEVKRILLSLGMESARVEKHPNAGRDVYPFLSLCGAIIDQYDVIGHLHTKKSPHLDEESKIALRWRELLLGTLLGSEHEPRMLDRIVAYMDTHPEVQIVFPDDPHVMGWGANEAIARQLVSDEEFSELPRHFDFPAGTMFWSRAGYLHRFLAMNLPERFTPVEPLPVDGTVLHAWERMLGARAAASHPPGYALTFVPGLAR